jgi:hypothetical protein
MSPTTRTLLCGERFRSLRGAISLPSWTAIGRQADMNYDNMGRLEWRDVFDENSNSVSRETFYYNDNGQLEWYDGPQSNPDNYVLYSYDGAGRKVQETHWITSALPNGTGIQTASGANQYSTTFFTVMTILGI